jgi:hypothetical protein
MRLAALPPNPTVRAVNIFHEGYFHTYQPAVQIVVWCMGIDLCLSSKHPLGREEWLLRLAERIAPSTDIYEDLPWNLSEQRPSMTVSQVAGELFDFRALLVHGLWDQGPRSVLERRTVTGGVIGTADLLREAASFLLRTLLLKSIVSL